MTNKEVIEYVQHTPHNINPVILKQKLEQQDFENRADWNQNDENAANFIKNRPFFSEGQERIAILQHTNIKPLTSTVNKIIYGASIDSLIQGAKYYVTFDGIEYECIAYDLDAHTLIGNASLQFSSEEDNGMPFVMSFSYDDDSMMMNYANIYLADRTISHTVKVEQDEKNYTYGRNRKQPIS